MTMTSFALCNLLDIFAPWPRKWGSSRPTVVYALCKWTSQIYHVGNILTQRILEPVAPETVISRHNVWLDLDLFDLFPSFIISMSSFIQLSHYLDVVEIQIAEQISRRSEAFFDAMISHDELQDHMKKTCDVIRYLRSVSDTFGCLSCWFPVWSGSSQV